MKRPRRDPSSGPQEVGDVTPEMALRFERDGWPGWRLRWEWWSRPEVPPELCSGSEPDPRRLLAGMDPAKHRAEDTAFRAARLCWLEDGCP